MRRWLAGLIGEVSQWLQGKLWPTYSERERRNAPTRTLIGADGSVWTISGPPPGCPGSVPMREYYERRESRGWNN